MNFGNNFGKGRNCTEEPEKLLNGSCGVTFFFFIVITGVICTGDVADTF